MAIVLSLSISSCGNSGNKSKGSAPPPSPPAPEMCPWDDTIVIDDSLCVEPPMCEWDDTILADDPDCVQLPCVFTLIWDLPTEDVWNYPLDSDELVAATLYRFRIPEEPRAIDIVRGELPPYVLMHIETIDEHSVFFWFHITVSNTDSDGNPQESEASNQIEVFCE